MSELSYVNSYHRSYVNSYLPPLFHVGGYPRVWDHLDVTPHLDASDGV